MGRHRILITATFILIFANMMSQTANHWETIIKAENIWKYIIPVSEPDTNWRYPNFNDNTWNSGQGGFGYGDNDDRTILPEKTLSVYFRNTFEITDTSKITSLLLNADYDDAFVAYINGYEIARGGGLSAKKPVYNSLASYTHEAGMYSNVKPESYLLKKDVVKKFLRQGTNVLSVQAYNDVPTSSDLTAIIYLSAGIKDESVVFHATPSWFEIPVENNVSNLPLVSINTNGANIGDEPKITAQISVFDKGRGAINNISDPPTFKCRIAIEIRGSSSQQFPKKSYGFETRTERDSNLNVPLLGLPAENDWVLYAPYNDKTLIRDILAYRLGQQMGHYASRHVLCELYLNGNYQGVYVLLEKIKQGVNRVNIANLKPTDISGKDLSGGYIFKIDKPSGSSNESWTSAYHPKQLADKYINFFYHYPKPEDIKFEQKSYIKYFVGQFETALASNSFLDPVYGYKKFIDVPSFIDYFIINEVSKNIDGYRISSYFHKDREDRGNKIIAGPLWDYNLAFGNANYYDAASTSNWVIHSIPNSDNWQVPFWWQRFLEDPEFSNQLKQRYTQLRKNILKEENINKFIDSMVVVLQQPQTRNFQKWPVLGKYIWPNPYIGATYQQEVDYMKDWIKRRLVWIDGNWLLLANPEVKNQFFNNFAVIYPNPFSTHLLIEIVPDNQSNNAFVEIFDITGKTLYSDKIVIDKTEKTIYSLTDNWPEAVSLPPAIYFLKIKFDSGKVYQGKIVKE